MAGIQWGKTFGGIASMLPGPLGMVAQLGMGAVGKGLKAPRKRRRKARLTHGDLMELNQIKAILGKTAAANALPYYLGRGRG